jgi:hypothetical protein
MHIEQLYMPSCSDPTLCEKVRKMIKIALNQGSHRFEWLVRRYDRTELPLGIVTTAVPFGERTLLSIVYRDISAQKAGRKRNPSAQRVA